MEENQFCEKLFSRANGNEKGTMHKFLYTPKELEKSAFGLPRKLSRIDDRFFRFFAYTVLLSLVFLKTSVLESYMLHQKTIEHEWKEENLPPFNELMLSWNAPRPSDGKYLFYISVKTDGWTPWLLYASWGSDGQSSFLNPTPDETVRVYQDALEVMKGGKATGFQIKAAAEGNANLDNIYGLHVYINSDRSQDFPKTSVSQFLQLPVAGLSQITLNHARASDLCSPTSTTAVVRYLSKNPAIDPVDFAQKSWDKGFDIFGNWVFNAAQAAAKLGPSWNCWVERLQGFDDIYQRLKQGTPVIISVRGPLPGSAKEYAKGHLMAVIGCDPDQQKVICMDPAFPSDKQTITRYDLTDLIQAWNRRGKVAYIFDQAIKQSF